MAGRSLRRRVGRNYELRAEFWRREIANATTPQEQFRQVQRWLHAVAARATQADRDQAFNEASRATPAAPGEWRPGQVTGWIRVTGALTPSWGLSGPRPVLGPARSVPRPRPRAAGVALAGQLQQCPIDFSPDPASCNAEDAQAGGEQFDGFVRLWARVDVLPVAHHDERRQLLEGAATQVRDDRADSLERDTRVKEPLDDREHQDVLETVEPQRLPARATEAGLHQPRACPVVELAVVEPGGGARGRPAVTERFMNSRQLIRHRTGETAAQALEERHLQLLDHPERALDPRHRVQLTKQLPAAGIIPAKEQDDQPQHSPRGEPEDGERGHEHRPGDDLGDQGIHQARPLTACRVTNGANRLSWRASAITAPRAALPASVS